MNVIEEFVSHNLNYKAIVHQVADSYEVIIYHWNEEELDDEGRPLWENIAGPFPVENLPAASALVEAQLADLAGESPDNDVNIDIKAEAQEALGHQDFAFLSVNNFNFSALSSPDSENFTLLEAQTLLLAGEFYYVEDTEQAWWSGFLYDQGEVRCWQKFDSLTEALLATK